MLTHIHPCLLWFTCEDRPKFNGIVHAGSASSTIQGPPRVQSPFARSRRYLNRRDVSCITSEDITPPSSLLRAHAPVQNPPAYFDLPYKAGSLQVVASLCWEMDLPDVISAILAQVPGPPTPGCLSGALVRFFPESYSLTYGIQSSAHPT